MVASNIAGYADVVTDGDDGVLVPPADPQRLAEELQALQPRARAPRARWAQAARESAQRYAWPRVAERGRGASTSGAIEVARAARPPASASRAASGSCPPTAAAACPPRRLPSLDPAPAAAPRPPPRPRAGSASASPASLGVGLTFIAAQRIGVDQVVDEHRPLRRHLGAGRDRR